ncbi:MAG: glycosyltransferase family 9 protein [Deltaproteobacteria bacterium]|nr:glycosyltransferase family 9 protein [Deltaproteobacteria bacterium]
MKQLVLVIHQGALGDVVLSFPALLAARHALGAGVALLAQDQIGRLARRLGVAEASFPVESCGFSRLFVDKPDYRLQAFYKRFEQVVVIGLCQDLQKIVKRYHDHVAFVRSRPPIGSRDHVAAYVMAQMAEKVLGGNGNGRDKAESGVSLGPIDIVEKKKDLLVIHPGAGSRRKRWALDRFVELAGVLGNADVRIVFLIGPADGDLLSALKERVAGMPMDVRVTDVLDEVVDLMASARGFVGNDSGLAHLAAFLGIPTVAVFGPSDPRRWSPMGEAVRIVTGGAQCPPCFETEAQNCKDSICLRGVSVAMVLEALEGLGVLKAG